MIPSSGYLGLLLPKSARAYLAHALTFQTTYEGRLIDRFLSPWNGC